MYSAWVNVGRTTFPEIITGGGGLRTDESFRNFSDPLHHKYVSPFTAVESLDMVFDFPLDPMHLVHLGVVKKYLKMLWKGKKLDKRNRLSKPKRLLLNSILDEIHAQYPSEFHRKRRNMNDIDRWKAVEFRSFLLYVGPIALKRVLRKDQYLHFLKLHIAIHILSENESTLQAKQYAGLLLNEFVEQYGVLYCTHNLIYNVHSLTHLANE